VLNFPALLFLSLEIDSLIDKVRKLFAREVNFLQEIAILQIHGHSGEG